MKKNNLLFSYLGLFASFGTLFCCAIPATLVLLGFGASVAQFLSFFPGFIFFSEYKFWVFGLSLLMLGIGFTMTRSQSCPSIREDDCRRVKLKGSKLLKLSLAINLVGFVFAFIL